MAAAAGLLWLNMLDNGTILKEGFLEHGDPSAMWANRPDLTLSGALAWAAMSDTAGRKHKNHSRVVDSGLQARKKSPVNEGGRTMGGESLARLILWLTKMLARAMVKMNSGITRELGSTKPSQPMLTVIRMMQTEWRDNFPLMRIFL